MLPVNDAVQIGVRYAAKFFSQLPIGEIAFGNFAPDALTKAYPIDSAGKKTLCHALGPLYDRFGAVKYHVVSDG